MQAKAQRIVKQKAPVQLTGGAGFRYENPVAARFLLDMLTGPFYFRTLFGHASMSRENTEQIVDCMLRVINPII